MLFYSTLFYTAYIGFSFLMFGDDVPSMCSIYWPGARFGDIYRGLQSWALGRFEEGQKKK